MLGMSGMLKQNALNSQNKINSWDVFYFVTLRQT